MHNKETKRKLNSVYKCFTIYQIPNLIWKFSLFYSYILIQLQFFESARLLILLMAAFF